MKKCFKCKRDVYAIKVEDNPFLGACDTCFKELGSPVFGEQEIQNGQVVSWVEDEEIK
jgi:hypothetical protein